MPADDWRIGAGAEPARRGARRPRSPAEAESLMRAADRAAAAARRRAGAASGPPTGPASPRSTAPRAVPSPPTSRADPARAGRRCVSEANRRRQIARRLLPAVLDLSHDGTCCPDRERGAPSPWPEPPAEAVDGQACRAHHEFSGWRFCVVRGARVRRTRVGGTRRPGAAGARSSRKAPRRPAHARLGTQNYVCVADRRRRHWPGASSGRRRRCS